MKWGNRYHGYSKVVQPKQRFAEGKGYFVWMSNQCGWPDMNQNFSFKDSVGDGLSAHPIITCELVHFINLLNALENVTWFDYELRLCAAASLTSIIIMRIENFNVLKVQDYPNERKVFEYFIIHTHSSVTYERKVIPQTHLSIYRLSSSSF